MELAREIYALTEYGVRCKLIEAEDRTYVINSYLEIFHIDEFVLGEAEKREIENKEIILEEVLDFLIKFAYEQGIIEDDGVTQRDLFDTKLMGVMTARPSEIICTFKGKYNIAAEVATD